MFSHFRDLLFIKAAEETWYSFIVYRVAILLLLLYLVDLSLPSTVKKVVNGHIDVKTYTGSSSHSVNVSYSKYTEASMEVNGRNIQDHKAMEEFNKGVDLYIHQSLLFGFIKFFHTESDYPKMWVNSFSPLRVFCFVPILMFLTILLYFYSSHRNDFDLVLKISVLELILSAVLLAFMLNA